MNRNIILKIVLTLLVAMVSCVKKTDKADSDSGFDAMFLSPPPSYNTLIKSNEKKINIKLERRCEGLEGPKTTRSFFQINSKNLLRLQQWTNENNFLYERAIVDYKDQEIFIEVDQYGCSHYGHSIEFQNLKGFKLFNLQALLQFLAQMTEFEVISIEGKDLLKLTLNHLYAKEKANQFASKCSAIQNKISCTFYEDPMNIELFSEEKKVKINYWFVL